MPRGIQRPTRVTELGTEIWCRRCSEFWPCDDEFFFFSKGKPHSWCKACYMSSSSFLAKRQRWLDKQAATNAAARGRPLVPRALPAPHTEPDHAATQLSDLIDQLTRQALAERIEEAAA